MIPTEEVKPQVGDFNPDFICFDIASLDLLYPILFGKVGIDWHDNLGSEVLIIALEFYDIGKWN